VPRPSAAPANPDTAPKGFLNLDYPKRLIEVDLPIKRISAHARREKSIRHGHISTLHIWWARRPLAACRAVICAALWPDPADEKCPPAFREEARQLMTDWAKNHLDLTSPESMSRFNRVKNDPKVLADNVELRKALLDFIADFANWDNSTQRDYLTTCRTLTLHAHKSLATDGTEQPLVIDPFAGGGSIPLEALRVGADSFATDLNPVAVLLNKTVLELIPKYGRRLAEGVSRASRRVMELAEHRLADFYPPDANGTAPIAYLWARTAKCEGPGCGAQIPLLRSLWLAKKGSNSTALRMDIDPRSRAIKFAIIERAKQKDVAPGTVGRGAATCPVCGFTTPPDALKRQLKARKGGSADARLIAIRQDDVESGQRGYRLATDVDLRAANQAKAELEKFRRDASGELPPVPAEPYPDETGAGALSSSVLFGFVTWGDIYTPRQALSLTTFAHCIDQACGEINTEADFVLAVRTCLAQSLNRLADFSSTLCRLNSTGGRGVVNTFARQALPMMWDFLETNPFNDVGANWQGSVDTFVATIEAESSNQTLGKAERASATQHPLPDDSAAALITDPPYYDAIAYGDLSDFFYVWLRRTLQQYFPTLLSTPLVDKTDEVVHLSKRFRGPYAHKTADFFEDGMRQALTEGRRVVTPNGIGVVVFAHKSTSGWEAMLSALMESGWMVTGSWPIDTERGGRMNAIGTAALASSVHIVCRPREDASGSLLQATGEWRAILAELPNRIHEWMPRLAEEGVVGADAIFACLGPALEIFSRYSRVEKASGEQVTLREYLEQVWAAVSTEALSMIFRDADATGLESDARFTAIVLWTLGAGGSASSESGEGESEEVESEDEEDESPKGKVAKGGYTLEYDAARKIAQGLGVNLEQIDSVVEVKGDKARLRPVSERAATLFGKTEKAEAATKKRGKKATQKKLFDKNAEEGGGTADTVAIGEGVAATPGVTALDRVHQAMLLFAGGRAEALKRFVVEDGVGGDARFWKLAQSLSALYPAGSDEKRWVDGVLARKKSFGF
jgi:putative DNA methylase